MCSDIQVNLLNKANYQNTTFHTAALSWIQSASQRCCTTEWDT